MSSLLVVLLGDSFCHAGFRVDFSVAAFHNIETPFVHTEALFKSVEIDHSRCQIRRSQLNKPALPLAALSVFLPW
jgi:hypothetical protein